VVVEEVRRGTVQGYLLALILLECSPVIPLRGSPYSSYSIIFSGGLIWI
jgi:hypothetical protein